VRPSRVLHQPPPPFNNPAAANIDSAGFGIGNDTITTNHPETAISTNYDSTANSANTTSCSRVSFAGISAGAGVGAAAGAGRLGLRQWANQAVEFLKTVKRNQELRVVRKEDEKHRTNGTVGKCDAVNADETSTGDPGESVLLQRVQELERENAALRSQLSSHVALEHAGMLDSLILTFPE
jgi:hypothetical protein